MNTDESRQPDSSDNRRWLELLQRFYDGVIEEDEAAELLALMDARPDRQREAWKSCRSEHALCALGPAQAGIPVERMERLRQTALARYGLLDDETAEAAEADSSIHERDRNSRDVLLCCAKKVDLGAPGRR